MYKGNILDTVYVTVQMCNIKLQHKTNFKILDKRKFLWEISEISEISMLNVAKTPFLVMNR